MKWVERAEDNNDIKTEVDWKEFQTISDEFYEQSLNVPGVLADIAVILNQHVRDLDKQ